MSEPVAVPVEPIEEVATKRVRSDKEEMISEGLDLAGYRRTNDSPYVADYLEIADYYKTNPEIASIVDSITEFIISETDGESLVFAAKDILDQFSDELNLDPSDTGIYRAKKIKGLIDARQKLRMLDKLRAKVERDIEDSVR